MQVLILEEDAALRTDIAAALAGEGCDVWAYGRLEPAKAAVRRTPVDVLVMGEAVGGRLAHDLALLAEWRNPALGAVLLSDRRGEGLDELFELIPSLQAVVGRRTAPGMMAQLALSALRTLPPGAVRAADDAPAGPPATGADAAPGAEASAWACPIDFADGPAALALSQSAVGAPLPPAEDAEARDLPWAGASTPAGAPAGPAAGIVVAWMGDAPPAEGGRAPLPELVAVAASAAIPGPADLTEARPGMSPAAPGPGSRAPTTPARPAPGVPALPAWADRIPAEGAPPLAGPSTPDPLSALLHARRSRPAGEDSASPSLAEPPKDAPAPVPLPAEPAQATSGAATENPPAPLRLADLDPESLAWDPRAEIERRRVQLARRGLHPRAIAEAAAGPGLPARHDDRPGSQAATPPGPHAPRAALPRRLHLA